MQVANPRRLLGADAIVTVPGRGLRFALDVPPEAPVPALYGRPSVVVLPFSTFGGDPDPDWLADGFAEGITTELSRFRDLYVVARNAAFAYRHMPATCAPSRANWACAMSWIAATPCRQARRN